MTDLRKAAEMAIDAMISGDVHKRAVAIIELRQALAQPEQEPVAWKCPIKNKDCKQNCGSYGCGN